MLSAEFVEQFRGVVLLKFFYKKAIFFNRAADFSIMIIVIGKGCMHFGEGQLRIMRNNFLDRVTPLLMPDGHILHANTMPSNAGFAAAYACRRDNVLSNGLHSLRFVGGARCFHIVYHTQELSHMPEHLAYRGFLPNPSI